MKVFIFDVGGVIKYPFRIQELYELFGVKEDYGEFEKFFRRICAACEAGQMTDEEFFSGISNEYNLNKSLKEMIDLYNKAQGLYNKEAIELLKQIKSKGYKVCILSNLKVIDYVNFLRDVPSECYDEFYKSYEIGHNKPDKEIYEYVINDLGVNPSDIVFFDDNRNNVDGARELGIDARWTDVYHIVEYFKENNYFDIM